MSIKRKCNLCNEMMMGGVEGFIKHGADAHPDHYLSGVPKAGEVKIGGSYKFVEKNYWCPLDSLWYSSRKHLARTIKAHGMTNEQYFAAYGEEHMPKEWQENTQDAKYGNAMAIPECIECQAPTTFMEPKWQYPRFCSFSCSTTWHAKHTNRIELSEKTKKERLAENPDHILRPNQLRYWIVRGHSEEEARELVSHRQKAGNLDRMIEKYGEEEGVSRYNEGLTRRKEAIHASEACTNHSGVSVELFDRIAKARPDIDFLYGENETSIWCPDAKKYIWVDCLDRANKTVIEFYGDYWHANPTRYQADDIVFKSSQRPARDIWERDRVREKNIRDAGYRLLIVWETDYRNNPDIEFGKCIGYTTK